MRTRITLACTECKQRNYRTNKNKKNNPNGNQEILQILQEAHNAQRDKIIAVMCPEGPLSAARCF